MLREAQVTGLLCFEAPQQATEQGPCPSEADGTPARWKEHSVSYIEFSENLVL
jgi:hypothetical protein